MEGKPLKPLKPEPLNTKPESHQRLAEEQKVKEMDECLGPPSQEGLGFRV